MIIRLLAYRRLHTPANPLNVIFCGSDEFSIRSLKALNELRLADQVNVGKIQVVTRPPKWCGRKRSVLKQTPIVEASKTMGLSTPIFCDTRQDLLALKTLALCQGFNTVIAVSFGKLIPASLLEATRYSMNVHPSLLPRYKGAAPIQYTLLNNDEYCGVTIQTLDPHKFDNGSIISQTEPIKVEKLLQMPAENIPEGPVKTSKLMVQLGDIGGNLLKKVIQDKLYPTTSDMPSGITPSYAPRIKKEMSQINWARDNSGTMLNKLEVIGPLYTFKRAKMQKTGESVLKRVLLHDFTITDNPTNLREPGQFSYDAEGNCINVACRDGKALQIRTLQAETCPIESCDQFMSKLKKRFGDSGELIFI